MSLQRALRGGCHCGRNVYVIERPQDTSEVAQVLFDTGPSHRLISASPLAAFIRVPLSWYRSTTFAFFPDETSAMIHRAYSHPSQQQSMRHFCGFCGTPLSYWCEEPRSEAEYILLTLGSLSNEDLGDLEELGLVPGSEADEAPAGRPAVPSPAGDASSGRETQGLPWFDSMVAGSQLGNMRTSKGSSQSQDGRIKVEWEVREWTEDDAEAPSHPAKRPKQEDDGEDTTVQDMEGVQR